MNYDPYYWKTLTEPKIPNQLEVNLFEKFKEGNTLLLGETERLRHLCDEALDLHPTGFAKQGDWFKLVNSYETIIGDGIINLVGFSIIEKLSGHCKILILRNFTTEIKNSMEWRYAKFFLEKDPPTADINIHTQIGCTISIWKF